MLLNTLTFHSPTTVKELLELRSQLENVKLQAGGTFLLNSLKLLKRNGAKTPNNIIGLGKIEELKGIDATGDRIEIKSMTIISDIYNSPVIAEKLPVLKEVCKNISTQPIRNMATIGGNLTCRYTWTEMPAVCIGLGAQLHFVDAENNEILMDPEEFFKNAAKTEHILTKISFPVDPEATVVYKRVKKSQFVDIPMLSLLIKTNISDSQLTNTRIGINNCVEFAQRDSVLEEFLNSQTLSDSLAEEALDHLSESIYDKRSNDYKKYMFRQSIKEALQEINKQ